MTVVSLALAISQRADIGAPKMQGEWMFVSFGAMGISGSCRAPITTNTLERSRKLKIVPFVPLGLVHILKNRYHILLFELACLIFGVEITGVRLDVSIINLSAAR